MSYIPRQVPKSPRLYQSRHQRSHSQRSQHSEHRHRRTASSAGALPSSRYKALDQPVFLHRNTSIVRLEAVESNVQSSAQHCTEPGVCHNERHSNACGKPRDHVGRHSSKSNRHAMQMAALPPTHTEAEASLPAATGARNWLGLSRVKIPWAVAQKQSANVGSQKATAHISTRPWASADLELLAKTSLDCWKGGRQADCEKVAKSLQRSAKDVRTALQLMLQEYVIYARKSHWPGDQAVLINEWAAAEFPKCAVLNAKRADHEKQRRLAVVEKYISALMCRSSKAVHLESLADMSMGAQKRDVSAAHAHKAHAHSRAYESVETYTPETEQIADGGAEALEPKHCAKDPPADDAIDGSSKSFGVELPAKHSKQTKQYFHIFTAGSEPSSAPTNSLHAGDSVQPRPSLRKNVNMMTRSSRRRKQRTRKAQPLSSISQKEAQSSATMADSAQASEDPVEPCPNPAKHGSREEARTPLPEKSILAQPNNHAIAIQQFTDVIDDSSNDAELSPELSKDTHDIRRLDGDIDMHFFDVTAAHRKFIRGFVDSYIERYFDTFYFRIAVQGTTSSRLCYPLHAYAHSHQSIADASLLSELEKDMLVFNTMDFYGRHQRGRSIHDLDLGNCNRHFHMCLLRAVEKCKIYEDDANWPSVDAYATAVYNRIIEDVRFLFFESQHGGFAESSLDEGAANPGFQPECKGAVDRLAPFKHWYYLGIMATMLTTRYVQKAGRQSFIERTLLYGCRPVPTASDFDNNLSEDDLEMELETPASDVAIRGELHNMIMELMPYVSNGSTMIAMQRSIEVYNKSVVEYVDGQSNEVSSAFAETEPKPHQRYADQNILETIRLSGGTMTVETTCILARWLSDLWFDRLKKTVLRALLVDHQFKPVPLTDVRRWIFEDRSPNGKCIDFILNTRLYNYLKNMRVLMNETKWLFASAAATLRVIELVYAQIQDKRLLEHASVEGYARIFGEFITKHTADARRVDRGSAAPRRHSASSMECALPVSPSGDTDPGSESGAEQARRQRQPYDALEELSDAPRDRAANGRWLLPEERLAILELEVADIRKKIQGVSGMQQDINEILGILRSKTSR